MWTKLRNAVLTPGNLFVGANALMLSAITWNPLAPVLYALGEPIWLYRAIAAERVTKPSLRLLEEQLQALVHETPSGTWIRKRRLPDYPGTYRRLVETRVHTARLVASRTEATVLEEAIVERMDDMLCAYLMLAKERLLFHCTLAKVYPQLVELERPRSLVARFKRALVTQPPRDNNRWSDDTPVVTVDDVQREVDGKIAGFQAELARQPELADVYIPMLDVLAKRRAELVHRADHDRKLAAQLDVFPDQFEVILSKLATPSSDHGEIVGAMTLLLEQTEDAVSFAEEIRALA